MRTPDLIMNTDDDRLRVGYRLLDPNEQVEWSETQEESAPFQDPAQELMDIEAGIFVQGSFADRQEWLRMGLEAYDEFIREDQSRLPVGVRRMIPVEDFVRNKIRHGWTVRGAIIWMRRKLEMGLTRVSVGREIIVQVMITDDDREEHPGLPDEPRSWIGKQLKAARNSGIVSEYA